MTEIKENNEILTLVLIHAFPIIQIRNLTFDQSLIKSRKPIQQKNVT